MITVMTTTLAVVTASVGAMVVVIVDCLEITIPAGWALNTYNRHGN